jgi:hypothetical protein
MSLHRLSAIAVVSLTVGAFASPAALAQQDLRNPDNRDTAGGSYRDLRNPDTRDAAEAGGASPQVTVVRVPQPVPSAETGLDWGDAGIGAGGMLGLMLLASGGILAATHRRSASGGAAATS